jgi:hypothetical protein
MKTLLGLLSISICFAQPTPTEYNFLVGTNTTGGGGNQSAQMSQLRAGVVGNNLNMPVLCAHNLLLGAGITINASTPITLGVVNSYTDSLVQSGAQCIEANNDMDMFVPNSALSAFITNYDSAWQHVVSDGISNIRMNLTINSGAGGAGTTSSQFTQDACNPSMGNASGCVTTPSPACSNGCFGTFAAWQAYYLGASGPVKAWATRWGGTISGEGLSTNLKSSSAVHELLSLTCTGLNPTWTVSSQCTAANWQAFGNAFVTLIRGISAGTCTNCPTSAATPMDLSISFIGATDAAMYTTATCGANCVCAASSTLSSCFIDVYIDPVNHPVIYLTSTATTFAQSVLCCNGHWGIEETVMPNWVINNSPQSESNSYRGGINNDWSRYRTWRNWLKTWVIAFSNLGALQMGIFNSYPLISYSQYPSCPNGPTIPANCTTANLNCGTNGLQCFGDIATSVPFIPNIASQFAAQGTMQTQDGQFFKQLVTYGLTSGAF